METAFFSGINTNFPDVLITAIYQWDQSDVDFRSAARSGLPHARRGFSASLSRDDKDVGLFFLLLISCYRIDSSHTQVV